MFYKILSIACLLTSLQVFGSEAWNQKTNFGGVGRHRGTGVSIGNRGYIGLGHYNGAGPNIMFQDWWEFDPSSNTWTQKANYPFPTYAASQFTIGHKCYVGTGVSAGNLFYSFDPIANAWNPIASVPMGATDQLAFAVEDKGYYIYSNTLYEYDPILDTWTLKNPMPFVLSSWSSSFTINGKGYVKSGTSLYEYKPSTDEWAIRASFPGLASGGSAAFAVKDKGYIVSGYIGWLSELTDEVWEFDPATNIWTQLNEFPGNARRFSSGFSIGDKGYVGIGTTGTNMRDFWEFDELLAVEKTNVNILKVFPNPASDYLTISGLERGNVMIYDLTGKLVLSHDLFTTQTITVSHLEAGNYVLLIQSDDLLITRKLQIIN
jgi:N-acetylneuraminic acid mutarotase